MKKAIFLLSFFGFSANLYAGENYNLFNPTPSHKLRTMETERPNKTDAATTVDAGHFMVETSFIEYARDNENDTKTQMTSVFSAVTLRAGLTQNFEAQIMFDSYKFSRQRTSSSLTEIDGFGDSTLRAKYNFFGNDGQKYALAIIPFVKIPTNQNNFANNYYEPGISIPFEMKLNDGFALSFQTGIQSVKNNGTEGHKAAYTNVASIYKDFPSGFSSYLEFATYKAEIGMAKWQNTLDIGVLYDINKNFSIDFGGNFGVSKYADDMVLFSGMAYRF